MNKNKLLDSLATKRDALKDKINKFAETIKTDPLYALEWADGTFENVAKLNAYTVAIDLINAGHNHDDIINIITNELVLLSAGGSFSTSQSTNLLRIKRLAAYAAVLEEIKCYYF